GASVASFSARAENGQIAAGILAGLAAGTILGAATAPRPYYAPTPIYVEPTPVFCGTSLLLDTGRADLGWLARSLGTLPRGGLLTTSAVFWRLHNCFA